MLTRNPMLKKVLRKEIQFYLYKNIINNYYYVTAQKKLDVALTFLARMDVDGLFSWKMLWIDEAQFQANRSQYTELWNVCLGTIILYLENISPFSKNHRVVEL